jgi:CMP-N-acetylneuraminic acid synthetase
MEIMGLIPIRSGSKRFLDKNFSNFCGTTLIDYTIKRMISAGITEKNITISTDVPDRIKSRYIVNVKIRPDELAKDDSTADSVVGHFINNYQISDDYIIVMCQVTSPTWLPHNLTSAINIFDQVNKPVISVSPNYQPNGAFYIFKKTHYLQHNSIYIHDSGIYLFKLLWKESVDIDYPYQHSIAEAIKKGDYL